jgi:glycosyltransferase involved in cell wall biosynthesis
MNKAELPNYILITPARNEAQFIGFTLDSMVQQTFRPLKWIVVSDGSTDGTDDIVRKYAQTYPWIEILRMQERDERHFAGKADAFNAGYREAKKLCPDIVGNLDADVSFGPELFEYLLTKFAGDPELGVGGAPYRQGSGHYNYKFSNIENVWGGCQLFRRECFEDIGGYLPLRKGSIDLIAVVTARMKGWKTRTFVNKVCVHHRKTGTGEHGALRAKFELGAKDYRVGNHPVWEFFRTLYQISQPPFLVGAIALSAGYAWSVVKREERPVSSEFIAFAQHEQFQRLRRLWETILSDGPNFLRPRRPDSAVNDTYSSVGSRQSSSK